MGICYNGRFKAKNKGDISRNQLEEDPCNRESADILSDVPRIKLCVLGESMSACHAVRRSNCFTIDQRDSESGR